MKVHGELCFLNLCRVFVSRRLNFNYLWLQPVAEHVVATFIKQLDEPKPSDNKSSINKKQPSADQMMKNLPLVMEGVKLYTQVLTGAKFTLPPLLKNPLRHQVQVRYLSHCYSFWILTFFWVHDSSFGQAPAYAYIKTLFMKICAIIFKVILIWCKIWHRI